VFGSSALEDSINFCRDGRGSWKRMNDKRLILVGRPIIYLENNMKMSIGEANSSCIDNEMLLKAISPNNDQYNAKTQYRLAVKEAGWREEVKPGS
jgi:hypothetical protein